MSELNYSMITVSGTDAFEFLQAQLATDMETLIAPASQTVANPIDFASNPDGAVHRSTWCNPKGRVICTPIVSANETGFDLTLPADLAESVAQRLTMFRFRSKVDFDISSGITLDDDERLQLLQAGIPVIALAQSEKFTPHMLNLDILQMVSVEKGCYPGQEIVARTHFRGASKRRCFRFGCAGSAEAGDKISDGERDIGEVVNALEGELLAVIPVNAKDSPLFVNDCALQQLELPYAV